MPASHGPPSDKPDLHELPSPQSEPLDYAPIPRRRQIEIHSFPDGGMTITFTDGGNFGLIGCLAWVVVAELVVAVPAFLLGWLGVESIAGTAAFLVIVPALIFLAAFMGGWRNNDPNEVIAITPRTVYAKPANGWEVHVARHELREINLYREGIDVATGYILPGHIVLSFEKHPSITVCRALCDDDLGRAYDALRRAMDATAKSAG